MQRAVGRMCLGLAVAAGLSTAVVGCSSQHSGDKAAVERRDKSVKTVDELRAELKRADAQVVTTQQALDRLATQQAGDLKPTYGKFVDEVSRNRSINESMDGTTQDLVTETGRHVADWDYRARTMDNDQFRQTSLDRANQARQEQVRTLEGINEVRALYTRYIRQLNDIAAYASNDLTPKGVTGMHDQVQRVNQMAEDLRNRMAQVDLGLDRMARAWSSDTPLAVRASGNESGQPAGGQMNPPPSPQPYNPAPANPPSQNQ